MLTTICFELCYTRLDIRVGMFPLRILLFLRGLIEFTHQPPFLHYAASPRSGVDSTFHPTKYELLK